MAIELAPERIREQLKLEAGEDDDIYLAGLAAAALRAVENETGLSLSGPVVTINDADVPVATLAALMLVATWYVNREAVGPAGSSAPGEMPFAVRWLLMPLKNWPV